MRRTRLKNNHLAENGYFRFRTVHPSSKYSPSRPSSGFAVLARKYLISLQALLFEMSSKKNQRGQLTLEVVFFSVVAVTLATGFIFLASSFLQLSVRSSNKAQAFAIAEAGIEYYRWHLAHAPQDFQDGTTNPTGPYVHNYYNKDGGLIGQFSLTITPPPPGSTIVVIQSAGTVTADSSIQKIIKVKMGISSFARYAWALNSFVNFGSAANVYGQVQSNALIHFDGTAHNLVASAMATGTDPDSGDTRWGVHSAADPQPPTPITSQPNIFMAGRQFPVPAIDFLGLTQNLASIKSAAQASGTYIASSSAFGYDLVLATSGIYSVYKVTALVSPPGGCSNALNQSGWGTWSIQTESTSTVATGTIPLYGNIFIEDNLWVRGQISNKHVTIASGRIPDPGPANWTSITVNSSTLYSSYNGSDTLALISQNNINVGLRSEDNLRVDGALMAINGRVGRYYYSSNCGTGYTRTLFTSDGMLGTNLRPAFYYGSSGYNSRTYIYDANLLYGPPPSFPLTGSQYSLISWDEVQ